MESVEEPVRKSLLDVIEFNFLYAKRRTYLHRCIYAGAHKCNVIHEEGSESEGEVAPRKPINEIFDEIVSKVNSGYCDEKLSGLLLYYPAYFCHMIEGSEESIMKHLRLLFETEESASMIDNPKVLNVYHHINQRFFDEWHSFSAKPPTLLEDIDVQADYETASRQVCNCIRKLYGLCTILKEKLQELDPDMVIPSEDQISLSTSSQTGIQTVNLSCPKMKLSEFLPEYNLLDFLLKTPHTRLLSDYMESYGSVKPYYNREDKIWPPCFVTVPFNVFDRFVDLIPDLPSRDNAEQASVETPSEVEMEASET